MNALVIPVPHDEQEAAASPKWQMKELKPWHKQMCSMLAQGIDRGTIAAILDVTPEYISMLARQPLIIQHVREMANVASLQLEAQFTQAVQAIGDTLANGNHKEKMQAARLQMEATKRIGAGSGSRDEGPSGEERLLRLAERLTGLLEQKQQTILHAEVMPNETEGKDGTQAEDGQWSE